MVAMVVNNALHFRVMWKFPKMKTQRADFYCSSLSELSRMLWSSEGISKETVESLYVHQIGKDDVTLEVIAIDTTGTPNKNEHIIYSNKIEIETPKDNKVDKPRIRLSDRVGLKFGGMFYKAYEAPSISNGI